MEKFICIHGHFYQPPRENPWLEAVESQDSAFPYHDWNERVAAESYAPNSAARILDEDGRIEAIRNNYSRISFNFGPTLLAWMQEKMPDLYPSILDADKESAKIFSGHGSAMAQVFNHMILPLANSRDKRTQVIWGIQDFLYRFRRQPEGMWLSETAVDLPSLEVLAEHGIRFTVLSPHQASRVRKLDGRVWRDVSGGRIDPTQAYWVLLPSGRRIAVFFYDAPTSQAVAFEGLLNNGERMGQRLTGILGGRKHRGHLAHIATDGESYGHHHRKGEMGLAWALQYVQGQPGVSLTNYGEYLEKFPPKHVVELHAKSAWSCSHGVGRWHSDCGCHSGKYPEWHQGWRQPMRDAFDDLRDRLSLLFETEGREVMKDPWAARDDFIQVVLDRSEESVERFLAKHGREESGSREERVRILKLMEMQRHLQLMYTSCGWFFDELSGIETVQVIQYASRAIQLAEEVFQTCFEDHFLTCMEKAEGNLPEVENGRVVYERFVRPARVDWARVGAHFAITTIFDVSRNPAPVYVYDCEPSEHDLYHQGNVRLAIGKALIRHRFTGEETMVQYGAIHLGDHHVNAGVCLFKDPNHYLSAMNEIGAAFHSGDFTEVIRLLDRHFDGMHYSLKSLFRDEQRSILRQILEVTREDIEGHFRAITNQHSGIMQVFQELGVPLLGALKTANDFTLNANLLHLVESEHPDTFRMKALIQEAKSQQVTLYGDSLAHAFKKKLEELMTRWALAPTHLEWLRLLKEIAEAVAELPFEVNLWKVQNLYFRRMRSIIFSDQDMEAGARTSEWKSLAQQLGVLLGFKMGEDTNCQGSDSPPPGTLF